MARRKPTPNIENDVNGGHSDEFKQYHDDISQHRYSPVDHTIMHHAPVTDSSSTADLQDHSISFAVERLRQRGHHLDPPVNPNQPTKTDISSHAGDQRSMSAERASSWTTAVGQNHHEIFINESEHRSEDHLVPLPSVPHQPYDFAPEYSHMIVEGKTLPTIPDPFSDTLYPAPIQIQSSPYDYAHYEHGSSPTATMPEHSYVNHYENVQSEDLSAYAGGVLDHFSHDTEAYASGNYSRASYHPPRSRSPTPGVDEEDYIVVGNESFHLTGHQPENDEKATLRQQLENGDYGSQFAYSHAPAYFDDEHTSASPVMPDTPLETRHFGPAPRGRVLRRHKTKKRVQLTNGNLVVDINVPTKLMLPRRGEPETMQTRYTAVTCDPDDFEKKGFFLRQNENGRRTELFIVITMYNEDEVLFCRTMYGVMRNIAHLCTRKNSQTWGPDAWKKVVVCIVADGLYQPGDHMKNLVNNKEVTAHLFEYTTSFSLDPNLHFKYPDKGIVPTQIIFCLKEKNQKKINSHRWFFNAFAPLLQPNVCVLLDVGTRPGNNSIYRLWKAFDVNSNVGGACGEISAYKGKNWSFLLNPLVAAQNFEYKISGILDKPTESMFGYISVLPGAFSAYRYIALQNDKQGEGPLASYFKGEVLHGRDTDIFTSNMYLAEDRILCFELVAKTNSNWVLKYVKGAIGETDVPDALPEFIGQRRRWLNGSFFAATYAIAHVGQIMRSGHSFSRKVALLAETAYNIVNLVFSWFSIGNFYLFFVVLSSSLEDPSFGMPGIKYFNTIAQYLMSSMVVACFLFSMGNKPQASKWKYKLTAIMLGVLMLYMMFCSVKCAAQAASQGGSANQVMLFSVVVTYGLYVFSSVLAFDPWHMITSFLPYLFLSPTYINILSIYAFSNLDDISWGTKQDSIVETDLGAVIQDSHSQVDVEMLTEPADINSIYEEALLNLKNRKAAAPKPPSIVSNAEKEQIAKDYYANVRTTVLLTWVLSNGLLLVAILGGGDASSTFGGDTAITRTKGYLIFILSFTAMTNSIRFIGSTLYLITRLIMG